MTGFDRPNRSFYLDDMQVSKGDLVTCKCDCGVGGFTAGKKYKVLKGKRLVNDSGLIVRPSARFQ